MNTKEHRLFDSLPKQKAPPHLYAHVVARIDAARLRATRLRFIFSLCLGAISGVTLLPALSYTATELVASGFMDYASLLFSDSGALITYWQEFSSVLLESLPLFGVTLSLSLMLIFLNAVRFAFKNSDAVLTHRFA